MLEGDPEVPYTSSSAIPHSHMAPALAEQSGRPACRRKSGSRNLCLQSTANFQFTTLGKQERDHTEHSGQEPSVSMISAELLLIQGWILHCYVHPVPVCIAYAYALFDDNEGSLE